MTTESSHRTSQSENRKSAPFAWQGWQLVLPARWNPIKLEGDYESGSALIADMNRPQLGIRWRTMRKVDPSSWAQRALRDELGQRAAGEAKPLDVSPDQWSGSMLFLELEPPGRDVWVARSEVSRRVIEIVHHVRRRDRLLQDSIVPSLVDVAPAEPHPWAVFDLRFTAPAGYRLQSHRLNTGDLGLTFRQKKSTLTARQIALAEMALKRMPLNQWLATQLGAVRRHYKPIGDAREVAVAGMSGVQRDSLRRLRYGFMRSLPPRLITCALHDMSADRLVILQASDEAVLRQVAESFAR